MFTGVTCCIYSFTVVTPQPSVLDSIPVIGQGVNVNHLAVGGETPLAQDRSPPSNGFPISAGLSLVHSKLVAKIEAEEFIEMSDLLCSA